MRWGAFGIAWLQPLTLSNANGEPVGCCVFEQIGLVVGDDVVWIALTGWFPWLVVAGIGIPAALLLAGQDVTNRELLPVCLVCVQDVGSSV
jgi:hypothetical protein